MEALEFPKATKIDFNTDFYWDIVHKSAFKLHGVKVVSRGLNTTTYEGIIFDDVDKTIKELTLRICLAAQLAQVYTFKEFTVATAGGIWEQMYDNTHDVEILNFEYESDTCITFTTSGFYDPSIYDFEIIYG